MSTTRNPRPTAVSRTGSWAVKVPTVTALFWVVKILTTGMGEAASDYLARLSLVLPVVVGLGCLAVALTVQLRSDRYRAATYWSVVASLAVFGTVAADGLRIGLGISLPVMTTAYAAALGLALLAWFRTEHTLSIHTITTRRAEIFYWITVLLTFALGTAAGDLAADTLGLGYLDAALVFGAAMVVPLVLHRTRLIGEVAAFWSAYVLTRPMGASVADWLGKQSGLGLGDGTVTAASLVLIVTLVAYLAVSRVDVPTGRPHRTH
ncbi:hypothetical protein [Solicola sp. PLA-1-18]|uniref:COG4705 family protein n=1 Tax=Solicola sp. PLA-1-18 TaxID=3380532 RepID=UPI003B78E900